MTGPHLDILHANPATKIFCLFISIAQNVWKYTISLLWTSSDKRSHQLMHILVHSTSEKDFDSVQISPAFQSCYHCIHLNYRQKSEFYSVFLLLHHIFFFSFCWCTEIVAGFFFSDCSFVGRWIHCMTIKSSHHCSYANLLYNCNVKLLNNHYCVKKKKILKEFFHYLFI